MEPILVVSCSITIRASFSCTYPMYHNVLCFEYLCFGTSLIVFVRCLPGFVGKHGNPDWTHLLGNFVCYVGCYGLSTWLCFDYILIIKRSSSCCKSYSDHGSQCLPLLLEPFVLIMMAILSSLINMCSIILFYSQREPSCFVP